MLLSGTGQSEDKTAEKRRNDTSTSRTVTSQRQCPLPQRLWRVPRSALRWRDDRSSRSGSGRVQKERQADLALLCERPRRFLSGAAVVAGCVRWSVASRQYREEAPAWARRHMPSRARAFGCSFESSSTVCAVSRESFGGDRSCRKRTPEATPEAMPARCSNSSSAACAKRRIRRNTRRRGRNHTRSRRGANSSPTEEPFC